MILGRIQRNDNRPQLGVSFATTSPIIHGVANPRNPGIKNSGDVSPVAATCVVELVGKSSPLHSTRISLRVNSPLHIGTGVKIKMERVERIELSSSAWKAVTLPLSYTRTID